LKGAWQKRGYPKTESKPDADQVTKAADPVSNYEEKSNVSGWRQSVKTREKRSGEPEYCQVAFQDPHRNTGIYFKRQHRRAGAFAFGGITR
jgi:hypothetical protein